MLDQELIAQAIRVATDEVFSTMLGAAIEPEEGSCGESEGGMMALVGLTGNWSGAGTFSCTPALANRAAAVMFMSDLAIDQTAINDEVLDAVAELTNMIVGNIKNTLEHQLGPIAISIPSVIYGRNFHFRSLTGKVSANIRFRWDGEPMEIKVVLAPSSDHESSARLRGAVMALTH